MLTHVVILAFAATPSLTEQSEDCVKRLEVQVSDGDPATFTKVLNVVANFTRGMSAKGEMLEIGIVAFNAGINLLRPDNSPVNDRVKSMSESIPDLTFSACANTIAGITRKEGSAPPISKYARVVPGGVGRLMVLDDTGYYVVWP